MSEISSGSAPAQKVVGTHRGVVATTVDAYKHLRQTYKFAIGLVILFAGLGLRYGVASLHWAGAAAELANDFGAILVGSVTITFVYDNFIRTDEKAIFLEDLRELLLELREEDREALRSDMRILMRAERTGRVVMVYPSRPDIKDKIQVIKSAQHSVIEIGTSLHTYVNYLTTAAESEYQAHVVDLLSNGVVFTCAIMNPDLAKYTHPDNPSMEQKIRSAKTALCEIQKDLGKNGKFELLEYNHMPYFAAICVDPDQPTGQMFITPYLFGVRNANAPSFLLSRVDNPDLFDKYWTSVKNMLEDKTLTKKISYPTPAGTNVSKTTPHPPKI